jgi:hypothetical protein
MCQQPQFCTVDASCYVARSNLHFRSRRLRTEPNIFPSLSFLPSLRLSAAATAFPFPIQVRNGLPSICAVTISHKEEAATFSHANDSFIAAISG